MGKFFSERCLEPKLHAFPAPYLSRKRIEALYVMLIQHLSHRGDPDPGNMFSEYLCEAHERRVSEAKFCFSYQCCGFGNCALPHGHSLLTHTLWSLFQGTASLPPVSRPSVSYWSPLSFNCSRHSLLLLSWHLIIDHFALLVNFLYKLCVVEQGFGDDGQ